MRSRELFSARLAGLNRRCFGERFWCLRERALLRVIFLRVDVKSPPSKIYTRSATSCGACGEGGATGRPAPWQRELQAMGRSRGHRTKRIHTRSLLRTRSCCCMGPISAAGWNRNCDSSRIEGEVLWVGLGLPHGLGPPNIRIFRLRPLLFASKAFFTTSFFKFECGLRWGRVPHLMLFSC